MQLLKRVFGNLRYLFVILSAIGLFIIFPIFLYLNKIENEKIDLNKKETSAIVIKKTSRLSRTVKFKIENKWFEKKVKVNGGESYQVGEKILMEYDSLDINNFRFVWEK
tara:strand:+ start:1525 stop:1851 length:327 start_codon:yes stop_codon:yes gene_type:complete